MSTNTILATTPLVSTNYLLRATGTTIGNSLIWDNGTNVGIGNTNTSYTLDVTGTGRYVGTLTLATTQYIGNLQFGTSQPASIGYDAGSGAMTYNITAGAAATSTYYNFLADGTSIVNILKGGNVGIGVTPNAWYTGNSSKALQIGVAGVGIWGYGSTTNINTYILNNAYYDSVGFKYAQASGKASFYQQNNGAHIWSTTDTVGTAAGDVLSFTQRMTITSAGYINLGGNAAQLLPITTGNFQILNGYIYDGTNLIATATTGSRLIISGGTFQFSTFSGATIGSSVTDTERMRITSAGNVGIGTTSDTYRLEVNANAATWATRIYNASATGSGLIISTSTTSQSYNAFGIYNGTDYLMQVRGDGLMLFGLAATSPYNRTTGTAANAVMLSDGGLGRFTSSLKYKKNITDYSKGLTEVLKLRPVFYEGKSEMDSGKTFAGLIAEEIHELGLTEFVTYANDGSPDAIAYSNMVALLVKAIQEQQAQIDELKNKLNNV